MLEIDNISKSKKFSNYTKIKPIKFSQALEMEPATIQSFWHAKLYLLKAFARFVLAFFWLYSGIIPLFNRGQTMEILNMICTNNLLVSIIFYGSCFADALIGFALLFRYKMITMYRKFINSGK